MPNLVLVAPRFLYLPLLGAAFALGAVAKLLTTSSLSPTLRRLGVGCVVMAAAFMTLLTGQRAFDFSSELRFWSYEIAHTPRYLSARHYFVGR